jgi:hypothetical protein
MHDVVLVVVAVTGDQRQLLKSLRNAGRYTAVRGRTHRRFPEGHGRVHSGLADALVVPGADVRTHVVVGRHPVLLLLLVLQLERLLDLLCLQLLLLTCFFFFGW